MPHTRPPACVGPLAMLACSPPVQALFTQQLGMSAFPYAVVWPLDRAESLFELLTLMTREWPTFPPAHPPPGQDPLATSRHPPPLPDMHICSLARTGGSPSQAGRPQTTELTAAPSSHSSLSCVLTVAPASAPVTGSGRAHTPRHHLATRRCHKR